MTDRDELLDSQVHDAYERIELSDEAQERIATALRAAQGRAAPEEAGEDRAAQGGGRVAQDEPLRMGGRRGTWQRWLPLAAAIAAVAILLRVGLSPSEKLASMDGATDASLSQERTEGLAEAPEISEDLVDGEDAEAQEPEGAAGESVGEPSAERFPDITLGDGTILTTMAGGGAQELDPAEVGGLVADATARSADGQESLACEVYELVGGEGYAVRYGGEQGYWRCGPPAA